MKPGKVGDYDVFETAVVRPGSTLFVAKHRLTGLIVGLKQFCPDDPVSNVALERELACLTGTCHPLISYLFDIITLDRYVYLAIEFPENGDLHDVLQKNGVIAEGQARLLLVQILAAFNYLHYDRHIIFRSLTPGNIRFDANHSLRVGDFSQSEWLFDVDFLNRGCDEEIHNVGSLAYTAPELLMEQPATDAVDIWSIGILFFEMVTGRLPFENSHKGKLAQKILREGPSFPSTMPGLLRDLIGRMLTKDPNQRITLENIKQHPWVLNEGLGISFSLNFDRLEELCTENDPSRGVVDQEIVDSMEELGLDVRHLAEQLLNGVHCEATCVYRQLLRKKTITELGDIIPGLLVKETRPRRWC
jgi:serine/threonine protein kinase